MVNIYRPLFLLPSPPALFRGPEIVGIPAVHHPALFLPLRPLLVFAAPSTSLFLLFMSPSDFPGTIKPSRRTVPTPASWPPTTTNAVSSRQPSPFDTFLVHFARRSSTNVAALFWSDFNSAATQLSNNGCKSAIQNLRHTKSLMPFIGMKQPIDINHPTTTYEVLTPLSSRLTLTRLGHFVAKGFISTDLPRRAASQNRNDFNVTIPVLSLVESTSFGVQYKPQGLFDAVKLVHTHPSSTTATRSTCEGLGLGSVIRYHNGEFNLVHPGLAEVTAKSFQYSHGDATCVGFGLGWGLGWLGYHRRVHLERRNWNAEIIFKVPDVGLPLQRL
ncbi:hypothetical protein C8R47DRAFT_1217899 [Mycena vitilis]|nr:hypothetical protein C8R47DRAFT_1217899 [Mycena vitilis]